MWLETACGGCHCLSITQSKWPNLIWLMSTTSARKVERLEAVLLLLFSRWVMDGVLCIGEASVSLYQTPDQKTHNLRSHLPISQPLSKSPNFNFQIKRLENSIKIKNDGRHSILHLSVNFSIEIISKEQKDT